mgnify:FL=1
MKGLSKFFDTARFLSGKRLEVVGVSPWSEYETKEILGTKISTVIADDQTVYPTRSGETISNKYEQMVVKVRKLGLNIPIGSSIELINPVGVVYGEYHNRLSLTADDVKVIAVAKE